MAQKQFPVDPIQTQLVRPTKDVTALQTSGPAQTGLVGGLQTFGKAIGTAAEVAKERRFAEDMITAGLYAAKEQVAPGLVSQEALLHNYNLLDENYAARVLKQVEVHDNNTAADISNHLGYSTEQKAIQHADFINQIKAEATRSITHNGEALGTLFVKLDGYLHKWNTDIAEFEKMSRMQNGVEAITNSIESQAQQFGGTSGENTFRLPDMKKWSKKLTDLGLQHEWINVGGTKYRAAINIDVNKALFVALKNTVVDMYDQNPNLYVYLQDRIEDYFKPLSDKEEALITAGKQDAIGDHQTFKSLFAELNKTVTDIQKGKAKEDTTNQKEWFVGWLERRTTSSRNLPFNHDGSELPEFIARFGDDVAAYIKKANTALDATLWGEYSEPFNSGLLGVQDGSLKTVEEVVTFGLTNKLDSTATGKLKSLVGEKKTQFKDNVQLLRDGSQYGTSFSRVKDAVENIMAQNLLAPALQKEDFTIEDYFEHEWVEKWLSIDRKVMWPKEYRAAYENITAIVNEQRRAISVKSAERVYDQALYKRTNSRTFTPDEVAGIGKASTELLLKELDKLAEWKIQTLVNKKTGKKREVLVRKVKEPVIKTLGQ